MAEQGGLQRHRRAPTRTARAIHQRFAHDFPIWRVCRTLPAEHSRPQTVRTVVIALGSLVLCIVACHTYGRFLVRRILCIEPERIAPSMEFNDEVDYVPSRREPVFGHHFTSIAGAGPIAGAGAARDAQRAAAVRKGCSWAWNSSPCVRGRRMFASLRATVRVARAG
ncbi:MAG: hypothetical protein DYG94_14210 [Leptolyngbya sp. PLA3]|nr:MAG: hypothetical protein EDM82_14855 [Cyanobacteria bacterium CYA]MCE7969882.1 hypothetical protein [Leptolyngbya sp. PL-A3]